MNPPIPDGAEMAQSLERSRNLSLARYVSLGFATIYGLVLVAIGAFLVTAHRAPPTAIRIMVVALLLSLCAQLLGYGLVRGGHQDGAARAITFGILFSQTMFHLVWAALHGYDAILLATFAASVVPIGLGSVLSGTKLMVVTTCSAIITAGFILLIYPHLIGSAVAPFETAISFAVVALVDCLIALLVYGAALLYTQALSSMDMLRVAYERALQLDALKDQFITHVNHELRTPIMTLQGTLEFLGETADQLPAAARDELLTQARRNTDRLVTLLTNVLDVRNIDRATGPVPLEQVAVAPALDAARELSDPLRARQIAFSLPEGLAVWGQATGLQQILTNYLSNAIKYSPASAPITVVARVLPTRQSGQSMVEIAVADGGPGIPAEHIPLLFHRFARLERDLASNVPGTGLGLYLCKVVAESMDGEVGVTSPGLYQPGSTFWVRLPGGIMTATKPLAPPRRSLSRSIAPNAPR